jgi:hypothetical protein
MVSPAEYREFALECMRDAECADDVGMRLTMFGLARIWMNVALELEQRTMRASGEATPSESTDCTKRNDEAAN